MFQTLSDSAKKDLRIQEGNNQLKRKEKLAQKQREFSTTRVKTHTYAYLLQAYYNVYMYLKVFILC